MKRWAELLKHHRFRRLSELPFHQARHEVGLFLTEVAKNLSPEALDFLPDWRGIESFKVTSSAVDQLDALYFSLEDAGEHVCSSLAYSAARFTSACVFFHEAMSVEQLMDAAYEAHHAALASGS